VVEEVATVVMARATAERVAAIRTEVRR